MFNSTNAKPWASKFNPPGRGAQSPPPMSRMGAVGQPPSPRLSMQKALNKKEDDMSRTVAEWDAQMDGLDKQQEHLLNEQWKLLRTQIGSLMGALSEMRTELAAVKEAASKDHIEAAIEKLLNDVEQHGQNHASFAQRVGFLEDFIGESADKQQKISGNHEDFKATIESRVEYLEGLVGDSASQHSNDLNAAIQKMHDLHAAVASCAKAEHHTSLEKRMEFVEQELGESADRHDAHKTSVEDRMEFLEKKMGDSAELHWKEIQAAKAKLGDVHKAVQQCAKQEHHASLEERIKFCEKELGESADKHDQHKTSMEDRMEFLEKKLGDSAELHWKEIQAAKAKLGDVHKAVQQCAKQEHHSSLEERMRFVEKELGESADKHDTHKTSMEDRMEFIEKKTGDSAELHWKEIQAAKAKLGDIHKAVAACAKQEHHASLEERIKFCEKELGESADKHDKHKTSIEDRMEFLEKKMGDSAELHWKEIQAAKAKLGDVHKAVGACAKQEHHASMEERLKFVEKELGESADKHDKHKTSIEDRMEFLETKVGDSAEKHWKEIQDAKAKLGDIHKAVASCAKHDHASSLDKRLGFLENMVGDNADKHAKALKDHQKDLGGHKEDMETRLKYFEALLGDSADKHWKAIEAAKKKMGSMEAAVSKCAKADNHTNLEERVAYLEKDLGDSADDHTKHKNSMEGRLEGVERKLKDFGVALDGKGHKSEIEKLEAVVLAGIDKRLTTVEEKHLQDFVKRLGDYEKKHMTEFDQMKARVGDIDKALKECANIEHYLGLDRKHGALSEQQKNIEEAVKNKMRDMLGKIDAQRTGIENHKTSLEQRMAHLETVISEGTQNTEFLKEIERNIGFMQEDQKRARDVLESSILEQIRLEHSAVHSQASQIKEQWERELRARMAYQENYKDLLGQERSAREMQDVQFGRRLESFERSMYGELQRMWQEIGKEAPTQFVVQQPRIMPQLYTTGSVNVSPLPSYVSAASTVAPVVPLGGTMTYETPPVVTETVTSPRVLRRPSVTTVPVPMA